MPSQTSWEYFEQQMVVAGVQCHNLIMVEHMIIGVSRAIKHGESLNGKPTGRLVIKDMLP